MVRPNCENITVLLVITRNDELHQECPSSGIPN
jgi:hypothetical protein